MKTPQENTASAAIPTVTAPQAQALMLRAVQEGTATPPFPFLMAVVELPPSQKNDFVGALEKVFSSSFGYAVVCLNRDQLRRGRYVTLLPQMEREGIPCAVLCLDLTDREVWPEDLGEVAVVLDFFGRFCENRAAAFLLTGQAGDTAAELEKILRKENL